MTSPAREQLMTIARAKIDFAEFRYLCTGLKCNMPMKKLTLTFQNTNGSIPVVCFPLTSGKNIYAVIDTGSDSTIYDSMVKEKYPEIILRSKAMGAQRIIGVNTESEVEVIMSGIKLDIQREAEESLAVKFVACEHTDFCERMNALIKREGIKESVPLLIGSDTLTHLNAKIDMKKKVICLTILKPAKKKKATSPTSPSPH